MEYILAVDVDVDLEEFWAQTIVSMPVLNTKITISIIN